jgi:hypothetical protein
MSATRAAVYLQVSTGRQADHDLSMNQIDELD